MNSTQRGTQSASSRYLYHSKSIIIYWRANVVIFLYSNSFLLCLKGKYDCLIFWFKHVLDVLKINALVGLQVFVYVFLNLRLYNSVLRPRASLGCCVTAPVQRAPLLLQLISASNAVTVWWWFLCADLRKLWNYSSSLEAAPLGGGLRG